MLSQLASQLGTEPTALVRRDDLRDHVERVTIGHDRIVIAFSDPHGQEEVEVPAAWVRWGNRRRLLPPPGQQAIGQPDPALIKLLVRAHQAKQHLSEAGSVAAAAAAMGLNQRYFSVLLKLAFLAPDIQAAILDGHQPLQLNRQRLARITSMPMSWSAQRELLGFS